MHILSRIILATSLVTAVFSTSASGQSGMPQPLSGPKPTHAAIAYAESNASTGEGHLLDLYLPSDVKAATPLVIFTHGSGWTRDNGRSDAQAVAAELNKAGYAVAGVAIRSSSQAQFPAQLHDIKAAIRWLRTNASKYNIVPDKFGIMGESSGGWTSAMAALTGDDPALEGKEGVTGVSSAVQASIAFYSPTDFLKMDRWALKKCNPDAKMPSDTDGCHDSADSPESMLLGCPIQTCPERAAIANPINYISRNDPPIMIVHGENDALVPHAQGAELYQALNKACHSSVFVSMPLAPHGLWNKMLTDPDMAYGTTIRSTDGETCAVTTPKPGTFNWSTIVAFFDAHLK